MRKWRSVFFILGGLFLLNVFAWIAVYQLSKDKFLQVNFFDVGQGDSVFIETPRRQQILIDGGPGSVILEKLSQSMSFYDRSIDLMVLTHPEQDHLSGLLEVLKRYRVENILWTGIKRDTAEYKEWLELISGEKVKTKAQIIIAKANQKINLSAYETDKYIEVLFPLESLEDEVLKDSNNASIILRLLFGESSFLFTGDIYKSIEKKLLEKESKIDSDVLKISHHGSKTSSSEEFVEKVSPEIAVISLGKDNKYGHPNLEVLDTLEKYGITVLRTDKQGDIKIISDGKTYAVSNFQN